LSSSPLGLVGFVGFVSLGQCPPTVMAGQGGSTIVRTWVAPPDRVSVVVTGWMLMLAVGVMMPPSWPRIVLLSRKASRI
jgi:hypothetical protein